MEANIFFICYVIKKLYIKYLPVYNNVPHIFIENTNVLLKQPFYK